MARLTPQQVADKWANNAGAASENYRIGVNAVTESPGPKAAAQLQVAKMNYAKAVDNGTMAAKLNALDVGTWKAKTSTKGVQNYGTGISNGKDNYASFAVRFLPLQAQVTATTASMPRGNLDQNISRMVNQVRGTAALKGKV